MRAVTLLINQLLPPDLRDDSRIYSKKGTDALLAEVAKRYPDRYSDIAQQLAEIGRRASYLQGETLTLDDMRPVVDKDAALAGLDKEMARLNRSGLSEEALRPARLQLWSEFADRMEKETSAAAQQKGNNLGRAVVSGARGNAFQLKAMLTTPALYTDYKDRVIPMLVRRSFGEGLRPAEYLASTYGVRKGVVATKNSTADAGDFSKQLSQVAADQIVTQDDCGTANGLDYSADDPTIMGRVLAQKTAGIPAGTIIDKEVAHQLRKSKVDTVVARSPMTCQSKHGLCSHCLGLLPGGKLAPLGYAAGMTAANSLGEPLAQGSLSTKHGGGGFQGKKKVFAGFDVINNIAQSPEVFPHRATVATASGTVTKIEPAPQGGSYISVDGQPHYALPGYEPIVKPGDQVEVGDQLSDGIVDVADVVNTRGLGEGRRYYVRRLGQAMEESGAGKPWTTNLEVMARAALDHVRVEDPDGMEDALPDDLVSYNRLAANYSPDHETRLTPLEQATGKILQAPALHYTIGTKLTPRMTQHLSKAGLTQVAASGQPVKFVPEMQRLRAGAHSGTDFLAKMHSSYLTSNLGKDAERARDTDTAENVHFAPRLAIGTGFGEKIERTGKF